MSGLHFGPVMLHATIRRRIVFSLRIGRYYVGVRTHPDGFVLLSERHRLRPGWHYRHVGPLCLRCAREPADTQRTDTKQETTP